MRTHCLVAGLVLTVAVPASAQPPGATDPTPTPPPTLAGGTSGTGGTGPGSAGNAGAASSERNGLFFDASLAFGQQAILAGNLQLGWMFNSQIGVFASLGALVGEDAGAGFKGLGVRLSSGPVFAETQFAWLTATDSCDCDGPCTSPTTHVVVLGAGLEFIHLRHFGMELRGQLVTDGHDALTGLGIGLGFYE